ncbi:MAG: helix-turn-helix domain-containing protein [Thermodesulfobacteria bacterium]|nr:helix-turn-helix domain-containing protein [Thermodesulfobacteriota bacterium]
MSKETVGEYLKKERELRQISIQEVAEGTKISISRLRLLEENRFEDLPAEVFVRGFIRNYAEYIGIDPEEAILRLEEDLKGQSATGAKQPEIAQPTSIDVGGRNSKTLLLSVVAIVVILLAAAGVYYFFFADSGTSHTVGGNVTVETTLGSGESNDSSKGVEDNSPAPRILLEEEVNSNETATESTHK